MSSCRATSFYLAPGVMRYFRDHTLAAVLPDGTWVELKHRGDIARLRRRYPTWDGTVLCGPNCTDGLQGLRRNISTDGGLVEIWSVDERTIEGRRPRDAAVYALHKWAIAGDAQAVGGVRQLVETVAPGAPKSVRNALEAAVLRGEHHAVDVVAAAWRAELLRNPDQIVELLGHARIPFRSVPEARLEQMLRAVVGPGRSVDAQVLISNMINGSGMLDAGTKRLLAPSSTSPAILKLLAMESPSDIRKLVAENPNTSVAVIEQLAKDEDEYVRLAVARNPNTPVTILEQLAKDDDATVRGAVSQHPNTPVAVIEQLAKDEDKYVCLAMTRNPNTPVTILEQLAKDDDAAVRRAVSQNPNTSVAAIEQLAKDEDEYVRLAVAGNLNTPVTILEQLAKDGDSRVRRGVAENPNTSVAAIEQLAKDEDEYVRLAMAGNLNTPVTILEQLAKVWSRGARSAVACNPNTPVTILEQLAKDEDEYVRLAMAGNLSTPVTILEQLAKDGDRRVRRGVAENHNTPVAVLEQLATSAWDAGGDPAFDGDSYGGARSAVARNPNTPVTILEQLAKDEDKYVRGAVSQNPNTPVAVLEQLAKDEIANVRAYVARNLNTPATILEQLAKDEEAYVRSASKQNQSIPVERLTGTTLARRSGVHDDQYEYHAIENGIPFELRTTADLVYNTLVQYGAPAVDYPDVITSVRDVGRANAPFGFADDTLKLRHTLAESTVTIENTVLTPRVISSPRALTENANYMGNCTAGYEHHIRDNESLIIALDDKTTPQGATVYNVEIQRGESGRWDTIGEINARFNSGVSDAEYRAIEAQVAELLE